MTLAVVVLGTMLALAGAVVLLAWGVGLLPAGDRLSTEPAALWTRAVDKTRSIPRRDALLLVGGLAGGLVLAHLTAWPAMVFLVPLAAIGLPKLLAEPVQRDSRLLEALDRWIRTLLGLLSTGRSMTDALRDSTRQAPALLAPGLTRVARRLDDRWPPEQALRELADEVDSADADAVLAALILAAQRGGTGATITLKALADTLQDRLRALREIEAERAKPRAVVRQITLITVGALAVFLVIGREFFTPYGSPLGQAILAALLLTYGASLAILRRLTIPRARARILRRPS